MRISSFDPASDEQCAAAFPTLVDSKTFGRPFDDPPDQAETTTMLRFESPGERVLRWVAWDGDPERVVGFATVWLTDQDNTDKAWVDLDVHPQWRRRGVGTALVDTALGAIRGEGRRIVLCQTNVPSGQQDHPHQRFLTSLGFVLSNVETMRHLALPVPTILLDFLDPYAGSAPEAIRSRARGYRVQTHLDRLPKDLLQSYCDLSNRLGVDSPTGAVEWEEESLTPAKHAAYEEHELASGRRRLTSLAIHEASGAVVAYTDMVLLKSAPRKVIQHGTLVHGEHRGHRLGYAVKVANLRVLQEFFPEREFVRTGNADANPWMVEINERLGFRAVEACLAYHLDVGSEPAD